MNVVESEGLRERERESSDGGCGERGEREEGVERVM